MVFYALFLMPPTPPTRPPHTSLQMQKRLYCFPEFCLRASVYEVCYIIDFCFISVESVCNIITRIVSWLCWLSISLSRPASAGDTCGLCSFFYYYYINTLYRHIFKSADFCSSTGWIEESGFSSDAGSPYNLVKKSVSIKSGVARWRSINVMTLFLGLLCVVNEIG